MKSPKIPLPAQAPTVLSLPRNFAGLAQLVEQLICNQQVVGSSPTAGSSMAGAIGLGGREPKVRKQLVARRDNH